MFSVSYEYRPPCLRYQKGTSNYMRHRECSLRSSHAEKLSKYSDSSVITGLQRGKSHRKRHRSKIVTSYWPQLFRKQTRPRDFSLQQLLYIGKLPSRGGTQTNISLVSKHGLQPVGIIFLLLFAVKSVNQLLASLHTLHF